jgi:hypothetical protein
MRYLLIVVGLLGVLFGFGVLFSFVVIGAGLARAHPLGELFVQIGAVFLAAGLATMDIVAAIKAKRQ